MARIRTIKPDFFLHERLAELSPHARLLFIGLWVLADREGRLDDRPKKIKAELFPWEDVDVDGLLWRLASREGLRQKEASFIVRYEVDGEPYIAISAFGAHQKPHQREAKSEIPPPEKGKHRHDLGDAEALPRSTPSTAKAMPQQNTGSTEEKQAEALPRIGPITAKAMPSRVDRGRESMGKGKYGEGGGGGSADHEAISASELVEVLRQRFPDIEKPEKVEKLWRKEFPDLDLVAETKAAHLYAESSGKKYDAPGAFLLKWFKGARTEHARNPNGNGEPVDDGRRYVPNAAETKRRLHEVFGPVLPGSKR